MTRIRRVLWPVPVPIGAAVFAVVLTATLARSQTQVTAIVADWARVSAEFHEALVFAGPLAGIMTLWVAVRFNRRAGMLTPLAAVRAGFPAVSRQALVLWLLSSTAFLLGLLPAVVDAAWRATTGGPDWLVVVGALPTMAAYIAVGLLIGSALPPKTAIVVGCCVLSATILVGPMTGSRWWPLAPVWTYGATSAGTYENPPAAAFRFVFFTAVATCLVVASATWVERRSPATIRYSASGLLALTVPALMVGMIALWPVTTIMRESDPPTTCRSVQGAQVCVHTTHAPVLDEFTDTVQRAFAAAGPDLIEPVEEVQDSALADHRWVEPPARLWIVLMLDATSQEWRSLAAKQLADQLSGFETCALPDSNMDTPPEMASSAGLARWIAEQSGQANDDDVNSGPSVLRDRLHAIGDEAAYAWIREHRDAIMNCELTEADLP